MEPRVLGDGQPGQSTQASRQFNPSFSVFSPDNAALVLNYTRLMLLGEYVNDELTRTVNSIVSNELIRGMWVTLEKVVQLSGFNRRRRVIASIGSPTAPRGVFNLLNDIIEALRLQFTKPLLKRFDVVLTVNDVPMNLDEGRFMPGYHGLLLMCSNGAQRVMLPEAIIERIELTNPGTVKQLLNEVRITYGCSEVKMFDTQSFILLNETGEVIQRALWLNKHVQLMLKQAS